MMKRKCLTFLCAAFASAALLTGCGKSDDSKSADTDKAATEEETEDAGFSDGSDSEDAKTVQDGQTGQAAAEEEDTSEEEIVEVEDVDAEETSAEETSEDAQEVTLDVSEPLTGKHHVEIEVKDYGTIDVELDADTAPITVTNFIKLAQEDFYDGLTFHRIMDGFMIQGGDPNGDGTGGSDETITGEFESNGVENDISHVRGVISMARSSDPDSASSQFFIVQTDSTFLDGDYAAFGEVTEGMDIVDAICKDANPTDDNGTIPAEEQPVIETIKVLD